MSEKAINPLYVAKPRGEGAQSRQVATARIENTRAGFCPKCQAEMSTSQLGQSMGNQQVFFCPTCRVATPIPV